jgi:glycopeptide antibiotics resistance protein
VSTWLTESEYALAFFVALVLLFLGPWISRQYTRFGRLSGWPGLLSAATIAYACAIVAFTLFPVPRITAEFCEVHGIAEHIQLVPFRSFLKAADQLGEVGLVAGLTSFTTLQVVFNVVFFVPLGFLLGHRWRKGLAATLLLGLGLSLLIETTQGTAVWGLFPCPYRVAEVDDLITNTTGALLGWFIAHSLRHRLPDPDPPPVPDIERPGLVRRAGAVLIDVLVLFEVVLVTVFVSLVAMEVLGQSIDTENGLLDLVLGAVQVGIALVLTVLIPSRRSDRGTPGSSSVHIGVVTLDGSAARLRHLLARAAVRYLPLMIVGLPWVAFGLLDLLVAWMRSDRRTLTDLISATEMATRSSILARESSDPPGSTQEPRVQERRS